MTFHLQEFAANWEDDENQLINYLIVFTYFDFFSLNDIFDYEVNGTRTFISLKVFLVILVLMVGWCPSPGQSTTRSCILYGFMYSLHWHCTAGGSVQCTVHCAPHCYSISAGSHISPGIFIKNKKYCFPCQSVTS